MTGRAAEAAERHLLHRELVKLEEAVKLAGGYSRKKLLDDICGNGRGRRLSPQTISGWMAHGLVANDFQDLWAFVAALLRRAPAFRRDERVWWVRKESEWKGYWEAAKKQSLHTGESKASRAQRLSPNLIGFLNAARTLAVEHPYPAVLPGTALPPLSQVYVRQQAESQQTNHSGQGSDRPDVVWDKRPAEDIVRSNALVSCLLGGPGAGKSSLLRMIAIGLADQRLAEVDGDERETGGRKAIHSAKSGGKPLRLFPVYVPAYCFTQPGSFAQQLASAVQVQLRGQNYNPPTEDFFSNRPHARGRWLVLIDGLDEISDVDERARILGILNNNKHGIYRFIIGSRPLPEAELAILDKAVTVGKTEYKAIPSDRYELLPFDSRQLPIFVSEWMKAAHVPDPLSAATAFIGQVNSGRLSELVRSPLMATILCQLHAVDPSYPLPRGRYGAYLRFFELLRDRFYECSPGGINDQLHRLLGRYGRQAREAIDGLPREILSGLGNIAFRQQRERVPDALTRIKEGLASLRSRDMSRSRWEILVVQVLRRTGLVVVQGDNLNFIHQTLREFLAAKHAADNADFSEEEFQRLCRKRQSSDEGRVTTYLSSYDRFLVAAWITEGGAPPGLFDLLKALSAHYSSAAGISDLIRDQVDLGQEIRDTAARTLMHMIGSSNGSAAISAAEDLASVDVSSAVEVLSLALKNSGLTFVDRARLSKKVIEFDPTRAVDVFVELSMDRRLSIMYRDYATDCLVTIDGLRAAHVMSDMIAEPGRSLSEILVLCKKLEKIDRRLAIKALSEMIERYGSNETRKRSFSTELLRMQADF
ncbi:hypothetical protein GCM10010404_70270 [Nonomuraea africana]|uniref:NACHT domain-containing protein n=1 Tax=Nonomuraea africana TaxID=46171 RepID=A0ABR9KPL3_9ACTN|nr:hypothetical protein [Nonomuraea africana]MBE1563969.1 hypothetical protein [Nonomuraea africana]